MRYVHRCLLKVSLNRNLHTIDKPPHRTGPARLETSAKSMSRWTVKYSGRTSARIMRRTTAGRKDTQAETSGDTTVCGFASSGAIWARVGGECLVPQPMQPFAGAGIPSGTYIWKLHSSRNKLVPGEAGS